MCKYHKIILFVYSNNGINLSSKLTASELYMTYLMQYFVPVNVYDEKYCIVCFVYILLLLSLS